MTIPRTLQCLGASFAMVATTLFAAEEGPVAPGHLEPGGGYLSPVTGATASVLPDGSVLVVGYGPAFDERLGARDLNRLLRERRQARALAMVDPDPKLWDAAAHGWRRLLRPPGCNAGAHYLHTATLLADGSVVVAGGLCDYPKMADDTAPWPAQNKVALFDARSRNWVEGLALVEGRVYHTATPMPDGSVLFAGGEMDPLLAPGEAPVLESVERYAANAITPAPPLKTARARHTATALGDGTLVVVGGFGADGRALASAEFLAPGAAAWQAMPSLHTARYGHTATLLADGRILVAGGKDAEDRALASTELWDPARREWLAGPVLPIPLNAHAAARLANGDVLVAGGAWIASPLAPIPWAWTWTPSSAEWKAAGMTLPRDATDLSGGVTIAPRAEGGALVFTSRTIFQWKPGAGAALPPWDTRPSIAALKGARALVVGYEVGGPTNGAIARAWDAATGRWTAAGMPFDGERMEGATAQLPSGRVIHIGVNMENTLLCRLWDPPARWEDCGAVKLEYLHRGRPQVGALPDGRAFAITGEHEAAIFDEGSRRWTRTRVEWNRDGFAAGAPVVRDKPFATLVDPASGQAVAIDDAGARYYAANLGGGSVKLLWDPAASRWAYVFLERRMGVDAQWLPDHCAISTHPLALFDPREADARRLADPGLGVEPHGAAMAVLDDGTVVVAGEGPAGVGGFFHRKASCAGFAAIPEGGAYIAADLANEVAPAAPAAKRAPPAAKPMTFDAWMTRIEKDAWQNRWLLLAILGPLGLYLLLRRTPVGEARAPVSRGFRIAIYAIIAVVLAPFVLNYVVFYLFTSATRCAESPLQCKSDPPWWVALARKAKPAEPPPCRFVGLWASQRRGEVHRIELKDDGTYAMTAGAQRYTGSWRVENDQMVWQHEQSPGAHDVNPITDRGETRFDLTEENGEITRFTRIRQVLSKKCKP